MTTRVRQPTSAISSRGSPRTPSSRSSCAAYYPGVQRLVAELERAGYERVSGVRSLVVLRKRGARAQAVPVLAPAGQVAATAHRASDPLVSCLMPTYDRRAFVPIAIDQFLAQDYPERS